jgi:2-iminobutanoate/2-iminopropanoate deaminase
MKNMKKVIFTEKAPAPVGPYSQAVETNGIIFCSGQIPLDAESGEIKGTDICTQTEKVCCNIAEVLWEAGLSFEDVVKTTCYLADMSDFQKFNEVYAKYFISEPARSCVAVKALPKNVLVEVEVTAVRK